MYKDVNCIQKDKIKKTQREKIYYDKKGYKKQLNEKAEQGLFESWHGSNLNTFQKHKGVMFVAVMVEYQNIFCFAMIIAVEND